MYASCLQGKSVSAKQDERDVNLCEEKTSQETQPTEQPLNNKEPLTERKLEENKDEPKISSDNQD